MFFKIYVIVWIWAFSRRKKLFAENTRTHIIGHLDDYIQSKHTHLSSLLYQPFVSHSIVPKCFGHSLSALSLSGLFVLAWESLRFVYASRSSLASKFIVALWAFCVYYYCGSRIHSVPFSFFSFVLFISSVLSLSLSQSRSGLFYFRVLCVCAYSFLLIWFESICRTCALSFRMWSTLIWRKIESNVRNDDAAIDAAVATTTHSESLHLLISSFEASEFSWDISLSNQRLNGLSSSFHPLNLMNASFLGNCHTFSRNNFWSMTKSTKCLHSSSHPFRTCSLFNTFRYMHFAECSKYFEMNSSCEWQKGLNLLSILNDNAVTSTCASDKWLSFFLCGEMAYKSHRLRVTVRM